jgi:malate dehydrogenase (oxaloacetate-decarboxylating)(NADP+)
MGNDENALRYHEFPTPGKISIRSTKPCETVRDLSLAYSPGVAAPCLSIAENPQDVYKYTSKGNLVAVVSNGTAVLGLGNIGPEASKPVMEGKAVLFKTFADIDVFDIELNSKDISSFVETVAALEPTFGGINLEDIKAPECFEIEKQLRERMEIPVFHDDQHGTAIIAAAGLLNALEVTAKNISDIRLVMSGAGAAAIASAHLLFALGLPKENLTLVDSKGVVHTGRCAELNPYKLPLARETSARTLADAVDGADVFFGLSGPDVLSADMLSSMAKDPIVFAMANPDPEIAYDLAKATRSDVVLATGRSDYPNQVNNVLGFPFIFRGALDVRAKEINEDMKMAAVRALAELAKEPVPDTVRAAYADANFEFGREYLIPKPFDPRVLYYVAPAVAAAAIESGVAQIDLDLEEYTLKLKAKQNRNRVTLREYYSVAKGSSRKRIAFPEGSNPRVLTAAKLAFDEGIAEPILLGKRRIIEANAADLDISLEGIPVIEPSHDERFEDYVQHYFDLRKRKGITRTEAIRYTRSSHIFSNIMLSRNEVDGVVCGVDEYYSEVVKPIFQIVGLSPEHKTTAGMYVVSIRGRVLFFADTTIHTEMTSDVLADIAIMSAEFAKSMGVNPRVAMLSYSNFGSSQHEDAKMVRRATEIAKQRAPELMIDGEMQADSACDAKILREHYSFSDLDDSANVLVFPSMESGNIAYKLLQQLGRAWVVGPIILGLNAPAYVLQRHASVDEIFSMITVAVAQANIKNRK